MVRAFQDDFLMNAKSEDESSIGICSASSAAEDQLSQLAEMVGRGEKLLGADGREAESAIQLETHRREPVFDNPEPAPQPIAVESETPPLDYDLEAELARALDVTQPMDGADIPANPAPSPDANAPAAPPAMEFGSMIEEEFSRANSEEQPPAENPSVEIDDTEAFALELNKLIETQEQEHLAHVAPEAEPVAAAPAQTVETEKDYSDPAAEFQNFEDVADPAPEEAKVSPPPALPKVETGPIDAVLGASAALSAAAIDAVRKGNWFREELYARFRILGGEGTWAGGNPLDTLKVCT